MVLGFESLTGSMEVTPLHFSRLFRVKEGKLETFTEWMRQLGSSRKEEAVATFEFEGVEREVFVVFEGADGNHYVIGLNKATDTPKAGDPAVAINQEHQAIKRDCLEPVSSRGQILLDLHI